MHCGSLTTSLPEGLKLHSADFSEQLTAAQENVKWTPFEMRFKECILFVQALTAFVCGFLDFSVDVQHLYLEKYGLCLWYYYLASHPLDGSCLNSGNSSVNKLLSGQLPHELFCTVNCVGFSLKIFSFK